MDTSSVSMTCHGGFATDRSLAEWHFEAKIQKIISRLTAEPYVRISYGRFRQIASSGFTKSESKEVLEILCRKGTVSRTRAYVYVKGRIPVQVRKSSEGTQ